MTYHAIRRRLLSIRGSAIRGLIAQLTDRRGLFRADEHALRRVDQALPLMMATDVEPKDFHHPYTPYGIQQQFMQHVYDTIEDGCVGILESPTGTVRQPLFPPALIKLMHVASG